MIFKRYADAAEKPGVRVAVKRLGASAPRLRPRCPCPA